jgi:hypothetical protein
LVEECADARLFIAMAKLPSACSASDVFEERPPCRRRDRDAGRSGDTRLTLLAPVDGAVIEACGASRAPAGTERKTV